MQPHLLLGVMIHTFPLGVSIAPVSWRAEGGVEVVVKVAGEVGEACECAGGLLTLPLIFVPPRVPDPDQTEYIVSFIYFTIYLTINYTTIYT